MTDLEAEYREALNLDEAGDLEAAAAKFAALIAGATDARFHSAYGICLQKLGHWSKSITQFEKAIALKPSYCEADWRNMLATSYVKAGQPFRAKEQWCIVSTMEPTYPSHDWPIDEAKRMLKEYGS